MLISPSELALQWPTRCQDLVFGRAAEVQDLADRHPLSFERRDIHAFLELVWSKTMSSERGPFLSAAATRSREFR